MFRSFAFIHLLATHDRLKPARESEKAKEMSCEYVCAFVIVQFDKLTARHPICVMQG